MYGQVDKTKGSQSRLAANPDAQKKSETKQAFGFVDNRPKSNMEKVLQNMKVDGVAVASTVSGAKHNKHVVADGEQAATAQANYGDSTFVRAASLLSDAIDADTTQDWVSVEGQSGRVDIDANIVIDQWGKNEDAPAGLEKTKPVTKTIDNTSTSCEIGAKKYGDGTIKVCHFKKN